MPCASTYAGLPYQQTSRAGAPPLAPGGFPGQPYQQGAVPYSLRGGAPPRQGPFDHMGDSRVSKELGMSPKTRALYKDFSHRLRSKETQSKGMRHAQVRALMALCAAHSLSLCGARTLPMHCPCTAHALHVHCPCTAHAPPMHRTMAAPALHLRCTCAAPALHLALRRRNSRC